MLAVNLIVLLLFSVIMALNEVRYGSLDVKKTAFLMCDMQEFFEADIKHFDEVVAISNKMIAAAKIFGIPVYASEHDPAEFGHTVNSIKTNDTTWIYTKTTFSMCTPELMARLRNDLPDLEAVVLFGVETHICIEQTVSDLLHLGYTVHVLADAVSSRSLWDRDLALQRLQSIGAFIDTSESVLYKLLKDTKHPANKPITDLNIIPTPEAFGKRQKERIEQLPTTK